MTLDSVILLKAGEGSSGLTLGPPYATMGTYGYSPCTTGNQNIEHAAGATKDKRKQKWDEDPTPRVSLKSQRMLHLRQVFQNCHIRLCSQHQWNWFSQKMIRTLLNWKTPPWQLGHHR
jgi:hypothetical protein